jgi:hypothetical protein
MSKALLLMLAAIISFDAQAFERKTDDIMPSLIPLISGDKEIIKPVRLVGDSATDIMNYTQALGPVYFTAKFVSKLPEDCALLAVRMEVRNTLTTTGKRVTYVGMVPMPLCRDGKPPKYRLSPQQLAQASEIARAFQKNINMSPVR